MSPPRRSALLIGLAWASAACSGPSEPGVLVTLHAGAATRPEYVLLSWFDGDGQARFRNLRIPAGNARLLEEGEVLGSVFVGTAGQPEGARLAVARGYVDDEVVAEAAGRTEAGRGRSELALTLAAGR